MDRIISADHSVIPACDVTALEDFRKIVKATHDIEGIGGYKVGFALGLLYGLPEVVKTAREYTDLPVIYDHQKAGTDIPDTGKIFAEVMTRSKVDAAILFPMAGPATQEDWIKALKNVDIRSIGGGEMTHPEYMEQDGGYISEAAPPMMYRIAAKKGVREFVVPGNKPEKVAYYRNVILEAIGSDDFDLMAPGFVKQKGKIEDTAKAAGGRWHAIVGSGIYNPKSVDVSKNLDNVSEEDIHEAAVGLAKTIRGV